MPIWNHRHLVGHANTAEQARRILARLIDIPAGWKITVRERDTDLIELPAGWIYSVHP